VDQKKNNCNRASTALKIGIAVAPRNANRDRTIYTHIHVFGNRRAFHGLQSLITNLTNRKLLIRIGSHNPQLPQWSSSVQ
jgi:hypothetical protein